MTFETAWENTGTDCARAVGEMGGRVQQLNDKELEKGKGKGKEVVMLMVAFHQN